MTKQLLALEERVADLERHLYSHSHVINDVLIAVKAIGEALITLGSKYTATVHPVEPKKKPTRRSKKK